MKALPAECHFFLGLFTTRPDPTRPVFFCTFPYSVRYAVDTFRWYICHDAIFGGDLSFSKMGLVLAHNADLCKTFGNLVHRSLSLMDKYNDGQ